MDTAIDSYGGVERSAKDVGAVAFAATVHNAATTARVLVGGQTRGGETDTSARQEIMRSILRVRLADTTLRLACAERGQFEPPFDS
jgi:hypothetical protein